MFIGSKKNFKMLQIRQRLHEKWAYGAVYSGGKKIFIRYPDGHKKEVCITCEQPAKVSFKQIVRKNLYIFYGYLMVLRLLEHDRICIATMQIPLGILLFTCAYVEFMLYLFGTCLPYTGSV